MYGKVLVSQGSSFALLGKKSVSAHGMRRRGVRAGGALWSRKKVDNDGWDCSAEIVLYCQPNLIIRTTWDFWQRNAVFISDCSTPKNAKVPF